MQSADFYQYFLIHLKIDDLDLWKTHNNEDCNDF